VWEKELLIASCPAREVVNSLATRPQCYQLACLFVTDLWFLRQGGHIEGCNLLWGQEHSDSTQDLNVTITLASTSLISVILVPGFAPVEKFNIRFHLLIAVRVTSCKCTSVVTEQFCFVSYVEAFVYARARARARVCATKLFAELQSRDDVRGPQKALKASCLNLLCRNESHCNSVHSGFSFSALSLTSFDSVLS
jgi:hypothetical protein